jgi:hypothetical protein
MIAATIIAKNPEKFGFKDVPYQQPDTKLAVAALPDETVASGKGNQGLAPSPVHSPTIRAAAYPPSNSPPYYAAAAVTRKPDQNSDNKIKLAKKPTPPAIYAKSCNANSRNAANGNSTPYAASMFGSIGSPKKDLAREDKSKVQTITKKRKTNDRKVVDRKSKKQSHALFALKREPKNGKAKTLKRNSSPVASNTASIVRTKPKTFQVSEAR